jgi:hypothetical protein
MSRASTVIGTYLTATEDVMQTLQGNERIGFSWYFGRTGDDVAACFVNDLLTALSAQGVAALPGGGEAVAKLYRTFRRLGWYAMALARQYRKNGDGQVANVLVRIGTVFAPAPTTGGYGWFFAQLFENGARPAAGYWQLPFNPVFAECCLRERFDSDYADFLRRLALALRHDLFGDGK